MNTYCPHPDRCYVDHAMLEVHYAEQREAFRVSPYKDGLECFQLVQLSPVRYESKHKETHTSSIETEVPRLFRSPTKLRAFRTESRNLPSESSLHSYEYLDIIKNNVWVNMLLRTWGFLTLLEHGFLYHVANLISMCLDPLGDLEGYIEMINFELEEC